MVKTFLESVHELIEPIILEEGLELIDIDFQREARGWVLRIYVDREGGINLSHCTHVSGQIGDLLEVKDLIPHSYTLEVSSPGLNRPLKKEKDFLAYAGSTVKIRTVKPFNQRKNFKGILRGYSGGNVIISADDQEVSIPLVHIAKANIEYQFPENSKKKQQTRPHKKNQ